jgi:hypothetical protein
MFPGLRELLGQKDRKGQVARRDILDIQAPLDQADQLEQAIQVRREFLAHKDHKG